jgi:hypothetical protein
MDSLILDGEAVVLIARSAVWLIPNLAGVEQLPHGFL